MKVKCVNVFICVKRTVHLDVLIGWGIVGAGCEATWQVTRRDVLKMETVKITQMGCREDEEDEEKIVL